MQTLWQDVRYAIRTLTKNWTFTAVAITTLALGIGANAAIFSVLDAVLLKPLPYEDPNRLFVLWERRPDGLRNSVSVANFLDWQRENRVFTQISANSSQSFNLSGTDEPQKISGMLVTPNHFDVLGVKSAFGRTFAANEDQAGHANVVVISHRLWQQLFAPDRNLLGKELILDGEKYAVIGVLKPDTNFDRATAQLYLPLTFDSRRTDRRSHFLRVYARLKPEVTIQQAQADMDVIAGGIAQVSPETNSGWGITLDKLRDRVGSPQLRQTVSVLFGAVIFVLLIACANLANLLLARTTSRGKEISIRAALGAGTGRLVRQFLTESLLLALVGGAIGLALGLWLVQLFSSLMPPLTLPPEAHLVLDRRVVLFAFGVSLLTGLFIGLIPAWHASRPDLNEALKEGGKNSTAAGGRRYLSNLLIISEVSLALVLLIGSVLLVRNIFHLEKPILVSSRQTS